MTIASQAGGRSLSGRTTSDGESSGRARTRRSAWRKERPDQAVSAKTSTTTGSTSVSATGSLSRLNLSKVVPFTVEGHGCLPRGGWSHLASSRASAVFNGVERPTIRSSPSSIRPATTSEGRVIGPMTAPQMISTVSLCFSFSQDRTPGAYGSLVFLMMSPSMPVLGSSSNQRAATSRSVVVGERDSGGSQGLDELREVASEVFALPRPQSGRLVVPDDDAAVAVPFGFVQQGPGLCPGHFRDGPGEGDFHRRGEPGRKH